MNCCDSKNESKKKGDCCDGPKNEKMKDKTRTKKTFMWVIVGILLIATIFLTVKASIGTGISTTSASGGKIDTTGWTQNELMNYQMHGIVPTRAASTATTGGASQVGSC